MIVIFNAEDVVVTHDDSINIDFKQAYGQNVEVVNIPSSITLNKNTFIEPVVQEIAIPQNYDEFETPIHFQSFQSPEVVDTSLTRTEIKEQVKADNVFKNLIQNKLTELVCKGLQGYKYSEFLKECILESNISVNELDNALVCKLVNEKRDRAYEYITLHYPLWKQLNITNSGTEIEKEQMVVFIQAVRDWSNDNDSTEEQLMLIQP